MQFTRKDLGADYQLRRARGDAYDELDDADVEIKTTNTTHIRSGRLIEPLDYRGQDPAEMPGCVVVLFIFGWWVVSLPLASCRPQGRLAPRPSGRALAPAALRGRREGSREICGEGNPKEERPVAPGAPGRTWNEKILTSYGTRSSARRCWNGRDLVLTKRKAREMR